LNRSNIELDRKVLQDMAVNEPFSFKAVVTEVNKQSDVINMMKIRPRLAEMRGMNYEQAMKAGYLREGPAPTKEEAE
jgi:ATP-dependent phosphoenolpyruvate carboxykinase